MSKYIFILGVGRSGTTFLGRIVSKTISKVKFISELFPGAGDFQNKKYIDPNFIGPFNEKRIASGCDVIEQLYENNLLLGKNLKRVERDDYEEKKHLIIKEVHGLLAFPEIAKKLQAMVVVITRDTLRVVDSYFYGCAKKKRIYLVEEYNLLKQYIKRRTENRYQLIDNALGKVSNSILEYIKESNIFSSKLVKQVCVTEIVKQFLIEWSLKENNVLHVAHEELSLNPIEMSERIFSFLGLEYDDETFHSVNDMTRGGEEGYFDTQKDSKKIVNQKYKFLSKTRETKLRSIIN